MAHRFQTPCKNTTCPRLTAHTSGYCDECRPATKAKNDTANARITKRSSAAKRGYDSRWRRARAEFLSENPLCEYCKARGLYVSATVVDHKIPHRGDIDLFWDRSNWQSLCASCHNSEKQRQERRSDGAGVKSLGLSGVDRSGQQFLSLRKNQKLFPNAVKHHRKTADK